MPIRHELVNQPRASAGYADRRDLGDPLGALGGTRAPVPAPDYSRAVELRNRERDAAPFVTKDGSTIREYFHTELQSLAEASLGPGRATQRHYHAASEEIYLIVEGRGELDVDGDRREVEVGDAILIPPGAWHELTAGETGVRLLCCCAPPYSDDDTYFA